LYIKQFSSLHEQGFPGGPGPRGDKGQAGQKVRKENVCVHSQM